MKKYSIFKIFSQHLLLTLWCGYETLMANPAIIKNKPAVDEVSSLFPQLAKMLLVLAVLVASLLLLSMFFKRVVQGKKKIGFLDTSSLLEVMTTKSISPKRHLMIIRAHQQVFLMANSEQGIHCLSELQGLSQLLKTAEQEIVGENFDEIQEKIINADLMEKEIIKKEELIPISQTKKMIEKRLSKIKAW